MAGTVTVSRTNYKCKHQNKVIEKITIDWVGDAADGSVPATVIPSLYGYIFKGLTIPGTPNPTASYNAKLFDPDAPTFNTLIAKLDGRAAAAVEEVYIIPTGASNPVMVAGDYTFQITGNSVNSAKGKVILYVQETF
jgi:hypothetical protein